MRNADLQNFIADLVAFSEVQDLPSSLYPYVTMKGFMEERNIEDDTKVIVLKIRDAVGSYHVIFFDSRTTIEKVEYKLLQDMKHVRVRLSGWTRETLRELLGKFKQEQIVERFLICCSEGGQRLSNHKL